MFVDLRPRACCESRKRNIQSPSPLYLQSSAVSTEYTSVLPTRPYPIVMLRSVTRVLVVEDELDVATLLKHTLERSIDAEVRVATSGDLALKILAEWRPGLILLDVNLPVV